MNFSSVNCGDGRELVGVFGAEAELAALAADERALQVGFERELGVAVLAEDLTHLVDREHSGAGGFDFDAGDLNADADFQVGGQERAAFGGDFELDVVQDGLGAAGGGDGGGGLKSGLELFAIEADFHGREICRKVSSTSRGNAGEGCGRIVL